MMFLDNVRQASRLRKPVGLAVCLMAGQTGFPSIVSAQQDVPLPRSKPPQTSVQPSAPDASFSNLGENGPDHAVQCQADLKAAGASFNWVVIATEGSCTIADAVELLSVDTGIDLIEFRQKPVLSCNFAALLGRWTGEIAGPVFSAYSGRQLRSVITGPGIVCRNRVGGAKTKVSEHAKGNAIDITGFRLSGKRSVKIGDKNSKSEKRALQALRTSACGYFTTVLGPGANSAHNHHFHVDYAKRGKSYNYRICE